MSGMRYYYSSFLYEKRVLRFRIINIQKDDFMQRIVLMDKDRNYAKTASEYLGQMTSTPVFSANTYLDGMTLIGTGNHTEAAIIDCFLPEGNGKKHDMRRTKATLNWMQTVNGYRNNQITTNFELVMEFLGKSLFHEMANSAFTQYLKFMNPYEILLNIAENHDDLKPLGVRAASKCHEKGVPALLIVPETNNVITKPIIEYSQKTGIPHIEYSDSGYKRSDGFLYAVYEELKKMKQQVMA